MWTQRAPPCLPRRGCSAVLSRNQRMPASTAESVRSARATLPIVLAAAIAGIYALGHLSWFATTPLGRVPVLDAREHLALANAIVDGTVPAEPFYRAPGYALLLAGLRTCGVPAGALFGAALLIGALLHAVNAALAALVARSWFGVRAAAIAGALVALDPVLVHFAIQASDATPAMTLFLAGLAALAPELTERVAVPRAGRWLLTSACWAAATVFRPNYLAVWVALPLLAMFIARQKCAAAETERPASAAPRSRSVACASLVTIACVGAVLFGLVAAWQYRICGRPGFLPRQGAYNLWAANQPGAHGRYYVQKLALPAAVAEQNPARAESLLLYEAETGHPASNLEVANAYWRARFAAYVTRHPLDWLGQLGRKAYALLNNWEQYNNETPAFHIARSPWLRASPISWGLLFALGVVGYARLHAEQPSTANRVAVIVVAVAGSALLFFVSARFRLPLVPLAAILAGGALAAPRFAAAWPTSRQFALLTAGVAALVVAFSNFDGVRDSTTFVQDHVLLGRAAATLGDDGLAWRQAEAALALRPEHPDALRLAVASYFNLLLRDQPHGDDELRWRGAATRLLATQTPDAPDLRAVAALALWRAGEAAAALEEWRRLCPTASALAARALAHDPSLTRTERDAIAASDSSEPLVRLAIASELRRDQEGDAALRKIAASLFEPAVPHQ